MGNFISKNKKIFLIYGFVFIIGVGLSLIYDNLEFSIFVNQTNSIVLDYLFFYSTHMGDGVFAVLLSVIIFFFDKQTGIVLLTAYLLSSGFAQLLKHFVFFEHNRPYFYIQNKDNIHHVLGITPHLHHSFPSGHTTTAFVLYFVLSLRYGFALLFLSGAVLVAYSRIYLFQHFISDVVAGSFLGVMVSVIVYYYLINKNYVQSILNKFGSK